VEGVAEVLGSGHGCKLPWRWAVEMPSGLPAACFILIVKLRVALELVVGLGKLAQFKRAPGPCGCPLEPFDVAPQEEAEQPGLHLRLDHHPAGLDR